MSVVNDAGLLVAWLSTATVGDGEALDAWASLVSEDERRMAMQSVKFEDRRDRICARALLRLALSQRRSVAPAAWQIGREPKGRPVVVGPQPHETWSVSVSHCRGWVACAVGLAGHGPLGVDVERDDRAIDLELLMPETCDARERAWVEQGPDAADRRARFVELWVLKEASLKSSGQGLSGGLTSNLARAMDEHGKPLNWWLWSLGGVRLALVQAAGESVPVMWSPQAMGADWELQLRGRGRVGWPGG